MSRRIRPMQKGDVAQISAIEELSFLTPWSPQSLEEELHNPLARYLVMEEEETGRILGYGGFWKVLDEGHITNVAVHPDCRRQKVGDALLFALEGLARGEGLQVLFLEVREQNFGAQKLYRNHGFSMVGLRKGYYTDSKEDAILMEKTLGKEDQHGANFRD